MADEMTGVPPSPDNVPPPAGAGVPSDGLRTGNELADNSSALDASASLADVVVLSDARRLRDAAAANPPPPPLPQENATAPSGGIGAPPKKGKTVDWGKLNDLLETFWLIYGTDTVWDADHRLIMKISNMAHAHGSDLVKLWKTSPFRRTVMPADVVFDPTETCDLDRCVNLFGGIELEPVKGDVAPFLELASFLTSRASADPDECDQILHYLLCWLAYPLQHPGTKLRTAVIMHGDEGAGKNFLFECVLEIYGRYGALVGQDELEDKFNDWRSGKCMVIGDEVASRAELVHQKNRLKALITSPTVQINPKNLPRREERNHINIVFLSNELQPLALDNSDRRYLVVYTPRMRERAFYEKLKAWKEAGGVAALYQYLLDYPLDDFDPYAPAPVTQAKLDLIELNLKSPEQFWIEWAGGELDLPYRTCSLQQAYRAYLKYCQRIGDRFPLKRTVFTRMVVRIGEARAPAMGKKAPVEWMAGVSDVVAMKRTTTRMLLVTEKLEGLVKAEDKKEGDETMSEGQWATECIKEFEDDLRDYIGISRSHDGGDTSGAGGES